MDVVSQLQVIFARASGKAFFPRELTEVILDHSRHPCIPPRLRARMLRWQSRACV